MLVTMPSGMFLLLEQRTLLDVQFDERFVVAARQFHFFERRVYPALRRTSSSDAPSLSTSFRAASGVIVPDSSRLPRQPIPKRVGSSDVNMSNSIECFGRKPQRCNERIASSPPSTPTTPSYFPALGIASM